MYREGDKVRYTAKIDGYKTTHEGYIDRVYRKLFGRTMVAIKNDHDETVVTIPMGHIDKKIHE